MKKFLITNWKMKLDEERTLELALKYKKRLKDFKNLEIAIGPSSLYLEGVKEKLGRSSLKLAAQNVAAQKEGSFTGETSARMLKEIGCEYAFVGHSERRLNLNETDEMINKKINQCYHAGLTPILFVGETLEEKSNGQREAVLVKQLHGALNKVDGLPESELLIAYEPVWAVGSGESMNPEDMQIVYRIVKRTLASLYSEKFYEEKARLLYGGSINSINAKGFWNSPHLDGLLVGTASLDIEEIYNVALQAG